MADASMMEEDLIAPVPVQPSKTSLSWGAVIAGTAAAIATTLLIVALGSGIGLSFASRYGSGPSATSLTITAALWLVMAQAMGFAVGGYLSARLRSPTFDAVIGETRFRDAAQGFMVWALGVLTIAALAALLGLYSLGAAAQVAAGAAAGTGAAPRNEQPANIAAPADYFVDLLFRPRLATAGGAPATSQPGTVGVNTTATPAPLSNETRAEVMRIVLRGLAQGRLDDGDRTYLAQVVSARTGLPAEEAERRVNDVETKARESVKEAADKAAKAGAMFSFWAFMSLLFGAAAATIAGMTGGQLRDDEGRVLDVS